MKAKFEEDPTEPGGSLSATNINKHRTQRDKLETAILNLATALGEPIVMRVQSRQSGLLYRVPPQAYQTASNTIVSLSERILKQIK